MRQSRLLRGVTGVILCALVLAGCAKENEEDAMMRRVLEQAPVTEVPGVIPSALVDQNGYRTGGDKIVVFRSKQPEETFEVRDADDDTVVYTGSIRSKEGPDGSTRYGQFGSFQTTGSYYIHTETTGASYTFRIDDEQVSALKEEALQTLGAYRAEGEQAADPVTAGYVLCNLLLAAETGDATTGGSKEALLSEASAWAQYLLHLTPKTQEEALAVANALAHMACVLEAEDASQADAYLTVAKNAWDFAASAGTLSARTDAFAAACALYRMTGGKPYENVMSAQFSQDDFAKRFTEDPFVFYGSVLYLLSRQPVNVAVRNTITEALQNTAKDIAEKAEQSAWFVSNGDVERLLYDMAYLSVANHISYNHGYSGILENHIHFLSGRNPDAVNFTGAGTERTYLDTKEKGIPDDALQLAKLLLLLGAT